MATKKQLEPVAPAADKKKALAAALGQIEKQFGKGSVMRLGENTGMNIEHIPTGSIGLDLALGIGGLPRGRIIEIYGPESSGKTTVALHSVAEAQKLGGTAAFIDAEMGDSFVGLHARMMSQAMRKLAGSIAKSQCVAIFINQLREKVGVIYGNPEVTTGGRALKFYASVRMEVRRVEHLKNGTELIGSHTRVKVVKNKVAPPFKQAEFDIMYGEGISRTSELVDLGVEFGILNKSGAWFSMGDTRLGQGRDAAKQYFKDHPDIADDVQKQIMEKVAEERSKLAQSHAARPSAAVPTEKAEKPADKAPRPSSSKAVSIDADDFDDLDEE